MKILGIFMLLFVLVACSGEQVVVVEETAISEPIPRPVCTENGQVMNDRVSETGISFRVYLPPCYERDADVQYPLLIWTAGPWEITETADEMIAVGKVRPFLMVLPYSEIEAGYDQKITEELLPYVEANYRTLQERPYRSIAGISHGAAIAARAAWRSPKIYGRLGVISGGIADSEQEKFTEWITAVSPQNYPAILIDIGEDDAIIVMTNYLTEQLDTHKVPYIFESAPGGHNSAYWSQHMEEYIQFLVSE